MFVQKCIIQMIVSGNIMYITKNMDPSKNRKDAFEFLGKRRVKKICSMIEKDKRVKTKIIML